MREISREFPSVSRLPFFNDEADPEKSWWKRQGYKIANYKKVFVRS